MAEEGYNDSSSRFHFNGEAGIAFFDTGADGQFPNDEFRVDEAKLFVEAEIWNDVFFVGELNLLTREKEPEEENIHLGELYVEFASLSKIWNNDNFLNVRLGRFDIPFGEEYLTRDAIDNPFISHSLSDIWGVDEGVEVFGSLKRLEYVLAVQNGGDPEIRDFNADKAVSIKLTYNQTSQIHVSFSAMRTGKIDVADDQFTELWFGNGFLRVLGDISTTPTFQGNLVQGEGHAGWRSGHVHLGGGHFTYDDQDTTSDNQRSVDYFQVELVQNLNYRRENFPYAGIRYSKMTTDRGFPLVGHGAMETFLFDNSHLATNLWRLGFCVGHRVRSNLLFKAEYDLEKGRELTGAKRESENFFGIETAVKF